MLLAESARTADRHRTGTDMAALYPLTFDPLFKSMLWGGRRLPALFGRPHTPDPVGEAWLLSDVPGSPTRVTAGPLAGRTLSALVAEFGRRLLGPAAAPLGRFPLLLKFIDAAQELSVQVHPSDEQAQCKHRDGAGKTEAWVILDADPTTSRIYAGLRPGVGPDRLRAAVADGSAPDALHAFTPAPGDCVFLPAGTVHAIGANVLLFEVQQTSDITYRLYDWGRVDARTGRPRELHVDDALACSDFTAGPVRPVRPTPLGNCKYRREALVRCRHFGLERLTTSNPVTVGEPGRCRVVVGLAGSGTVGGVPVRVGDVVLLPAEIGEAEFVPDGTATVLECGLPE